MNPFTYLYMILSVHVEDLARPAVDVVLHVLVEKGLVESLPIDAVGLVQLENALQLL